MALLLLAGWNRTSVVVRRPHDPGPAQVFPESDGPFPDRTASDVVSYADHVTLATAVKETEAERDAQPTPSPSVEQTIPRRITFRVDQTLWSRSDAPPPPTQFTAVWWGWLLRDGRRVPFVLHGMPWVVVGAQYVMPIAQDGTTFAPIQPFAVFRFNDGAVALEDQDTPLALQLAGASPDGVAAVFANAVPDPLSVQYAHLHPRARLAAVMAARPTASADAM